MSNKRPYTPPQVFRVELNHEQAILSTCSTTAANAMAGGGSASCRSTACKTDGNIPDGMTRDAGPRPS